MPTLTVQARLILTHTLADHQQRSSTYLLRKKTELFAFFNILSPYQRLEFNQSKQSFKPNIDFLSSD